MSAEHESSHELADSVGGLRRNIGFWGASAIMVGIIIGSGIFRTPPDIARLLDKTWLILLMWGLGGLLSLFGAFTYSELAVMYPQAGGVYVFLREGYGRCMAFVFGWTYLLISKPTAAAGIALLFGEQFNTAVGLPASDPRIPTTVLLVVLTIVNCLGNTLGGGLAIVFTSIKAAALLLIVLFGAFKLTAITTASSSPTELPLALALTSVFSSILWTYDGWSDVGAIAGEVRRPQKMLPRIYFTGTLAVTLLYVAVNAVYIRIMPLSEMRTVTDVAPVVAQRLIGNVGLWILTIVILISAAGSTHGSIITGARISFAQALDGLLFRPLAHVNPRFGTPTTSLWIQLVLSCIALWVLQGFKELTDSFVFTMWIFYGLAGASIFILRKKRPNAPRPYRCVLYPIVPAIFVLASLAMTVMSIIQDLAEPPYYTLVWIGVLLAGIPVYFLYEFTQRNSPPRRHARGE
ncbi:MAG TPA: amino acid permease [Phycisphaerales bacterium]|nr:amino acid permease [Phycisphaerales bacterium]